MMLSALVLSCWSEIYRRVKPVLRCYAACGRAWCSQRDDLCGRGQLARTSLVAAVKLLKGTKKETSMQLT
jgi:hypothetical protein